VKKNTLLILAVVCVVLIGIFYFVSREKMKSISSLETGITAPFEIDPEKIANITISDETTKVNLSLENDEWRVEEKSNYPADFKKIYEFILSVLQIKPVQMVTEKKDYYDRFGVKDHGENSNSKMISLNDKDNRELLKIILGQERAVSKGMPGGQYMRIFGKNQVYLISKELDAPSEPADWLNKDILDVQRKDIRSIAVSAPQEEEKVLLSKKDQNSEFELDHIPEGKKMNTGTVNLLSDGLTGLRFEEVYPPDSDMVKDLAFDTTYTAALFNGTVYNVTISEKDNKVYIKIVPSYEPPPTPVKEESQKASDKKADDVLESPAAVMKKVEEQKALFTQWVYQVPIPSKRQVYQN